MKASQGRVLKIVRMQIKRHGYLESPSERSAESYEQIVKPEKIEKIKNFTMMTDIGDGVTIWQSA